MIKMYENGMNGILADGNNNTIFSFLNTTITIEMGLGKTLQSVWKNKKKKKKLIISFLDFIFSIS